MITLPSYYPFVTLTVISSVEMNAVLQALSVNAANTAGDTMTGALLFSPDNTVDIGASGATRPRRLYVASEVIAPLVTADAFVGDGLGLTGIPESSLTDGAILARVAANETISGVWTFAHEVYASDFVGSGTNLTAIPESAITNALILARVGDNESITGVWTFVTGPVKLFKTDAPTDYKRYRITLTDAHLAIQTSNDGESTSVDALTIAGYQGGSAVAVETALFVDGGQYLGAPGKLNVTTADGTNTLTLVDATTRVRVTTGGTASNDVLHGMTGGNDGRVVYLQHVGPTGGGMGTLQITHDSGSVSATNRFYTPAGALLSLNLFQVYTLIYDGTLQRWLVG